MLLQTLDLVYQALPPEGSRAYLSICACSIAMIFSTRRRPRTFASGEMGGGFSLDALPIDCLGRDALSLHMLAVPNYIRMRKKRAVSHATSHKGYPARTIAASPWGALVARRP